MDLQFFKFSPSHAILRRRRKHALIRVANQRDFENSVVGCKYTWAQQTWRLVYTDVRTAHSLFEGSSRLAHGSDFAIGDHIRQKKSNLIMVRQVIAPRAQVT